MGDYGSEHMRRDVCAFDRNLYWNASGKPVLFGDKTLRPVAGDGPGQGQPQSPTRCSMDPAKGDFRLRPGSPAAKIGFEPWDFSTVGPRQSEAR